MRNKGWFEQLSWQRLGTAKVRCITGCCGIAVAMMIPGWSAAQTAGTPIATPETHVSAPEGYTIHHSVDLGGHFSNVDGSMAMYDTLVNEQSGPRVLGETVELHALPTTKHTFLDDLKGFSSGFGGDANNMVKLDFSKRKQYEFSGTFRRDRQYFDYDLMGNPNIMPGNYINNMSSGTAVPKIAWGELSHSPEMFNTVRHMLDTKVTVKPQSQFTWHFGYSEGIFQGPTLSPAYSIGVSYALLQEFQRNGNDEYSIGLDWKPASHTKVSLEAIANKYKADSYFTLNPNGYLAQEADGTPVYLGNWNQQTPYGISVSAVCNTASMGTGYTSATTYSIITASSVPGSLPVINSACNALTSYIRSQATRIFTPTEVLRVQSSAIKNVEMNGDFRYTEATSKMPSYYENSEGLNGIVRSIIYSGGYARGHRSVVSADYALTWKPMRDVTISDSINFSNTQQPGYSNIPKPTTLSTPASSTGNATINYNGTLVSGTGSLPHGINGTLTNYYFGERILTNNLTLSWNATNWSVYSLTYRYSTKYLDRGAVHGSPMNYTALTDPISGALTFNENGGIFNAALRPKSNLDISGTVEALFTDNVLTAVSPRQTYHFRVHTKYRPNAFTTINGSYNELERYNNTNNNAQSVTNGIATNYGQLQHHDYNRTASVGASINPKETYGFDVYYAYSRIFTTTNICYTSGAAAASATSVAQTGTASVTSTGAANLCSATTPLWRAADFSDAPTHFGSVSMMLAPQKNVQTNFGYRVSHVAGSQFYSTAQQVNGSLSSEYQTPFVNVAWKIHPGLTWKADYNVFRYSEFGPSGPQYCVSPTGTAPLTTVVSCTSLSLPTGLTESVSGLTDPRTFTANNLTMGIHYEF